MATGYWSPRSYASPVEFSEVIKKRKMVRAYTDEPVDAAVRDTILAAANRAPSAGFSQGYALLTLEGPDQLGPFWQLVSSYHDEANSAAGSATSSATSSGTSAGPSFEPVTRAPLVVIPLSCKDIYLDRYARPDKGWIDRDEAHWPVPYWDIDTGFTALLMLLAAVDAGLGALFFGIPPMLIGDFRELYGVPESYLPIGAVAIGHPDTAADSGGSSRVIKRRSLEDLVHVGRW